MRFGSLFSGIGGLDLGLERAGMTCAWQVEFDPFCQQVLAKHWPDVPRHGDIKEVDPAVLEPVDLICGGFPCQPVSVAGRQAAQADERWLWPEMARLVRYLRPRYVLVENVPGLLTAASGRAAQEVFGDLASLGFDAEWTRISASDAGASHQRKRLFVVAYPAGSGLEGRQRVFATAWKDAESPDFPWAPTSHPRPRTDDGVPLEVDRRKALGNAVVPQVAEMVGRQIVRFDEQS